MSCLETVPGAPWIKMLNADSDKVGTLQPNESLALNFEINAASAPLEKGNKAMLVVKSNDPAQPVINFPIYLDNNAAPEVTAPSQIVYAKEAETTRVEVEVKDVENDDFAIRLDDSGNMSKIQSVTAINGTQAEITIDGNNVSVKNAAEGVKMIIGITPEYGDAGEYTLTVTATDTCILERQATVNYVVEHTNRAPEASTIANISIVEGSSSNVIKFADYFTDPDGDEMTYSMIFTADDIVTAYTTETGVIFYGETVGSVYVAIIATDVNGAESATYFEVTVTELSGIENISINANQTLLVLPNWGADIDDPAIQKVSNLTFRKIEAVSSKASLIVYPFKKDMFENISIEDSTFTFRPGAAGPAKKHWTQSDFGIINQLGGKDGLLTNCKGISPDGIPLLLKRDR
jgi:hypothetical protein